MHPSTSALLPACERADLEIRQLSPPSPHKVTNIPSAYQIPLHLICLAISISQQQRSPRKVAKSSTKGFIELSGTPDILPFCFPQPSLVRISSHSGLQFTSSFCLPRIRARHLELVTLHFSSDILLGMRCTKRSTLYRLPFLFTQRLVFEGWKSTF
jgi:hypothetical protein